MRGDGTRPASRQGCGRRGTPAAARGSGRSGALPYKQRSRFQHNKQKTERQAAEGGGGHLASLRARGWDATCRRARLREARNACGCPRRRRMRCFALKAFVVSAQKQKKQAAETGEGTLRYCEGMGRDLPAGRAAGGAERLRLPAAVADALHAANNRTDVRLHIKPTSQLLSNVNTYDNGLKPKINPKRPSIRITCKTYRVQCTCVTVILTSLYHGRAGHNSGRKSKTRHFQKLPSFYWTVLVT